MTMLTGSGTLNDLTAKVIGYAHPIYTTWSPIWIKLAHVREGAGGFLDGTYLVAHPREWEDHTAVTPRKPTKKLKARRALASYENFGGTIIDAKKSALFRERPVRRVGTGATKTDTPLELWWDDVDGTGTDMDAFMAMAWDVAATFGHAFIYLDQSPRGAASAQSALTAADDQAPYLCLYTPLDALDWLESPRGDLTAIKLVEGTPRDSFDELALPLPQIRLVDEQGWQLYNRQSGQALEAGTHSLGRLPVVVLYAQRRPLIPRIGQSVLQDPHLFIDLYNLLSELRELLRSQTFSLLNVPLGTGADAMGVEQAKALLGGVTGVENVLFSGTAASFIAADATNVATYQEEIQRRLRMIYRLCALHWDSDKRGVEATGSVELKREDMNQRLSAYADEIETAEYALVDLWYRATYGADTGPQKMETDTITIHYPDTFEVTPFDQVLAQAQAAITLGMPTEFLKELRKDLVTKFLPNVTTDKQTQIDQAIEAATPDLTPADQAKQRLDLTQQALKGGNKPPASGTADAGAPKKPAVAA